MTTNPKIFRKSVRDFINKEFSSCSLYLLVKQPCHELQKGQPGFKLHSTELFYLVLYVLDALKTMPEEEERQLFILDIQQELEEWIYENSGEEQLGSAVAMVLCAASILLAMSDSPLYTANSIRLKRLIIDDYDELCAKMDLLFAQRLAQLPHTDRVQQELAAYLESAQCYSDEIDDFREQVEAMEEDSMPSTAEECPFMIADKKLYRVYATVRAIYQVGWLVGLDEKELEKCQGIAMEFILRYGFGIKDPKKAYQSLHSAEERDENTPIKVINELLVAATAYVEAKKKKKGLL